MKRSSRARLRRRSPSFGAGTADASCGSAFCFVNTNWSLQGIWTQPGPHVDLRYEYIDQDQPMSGSQKVSVGEIPRHHDEVSTLNQNTIATLDYGFSPGMGRDGRRARREPRSRTHPQPPRRADSSSSGISRNSATSASRVAGRRCIGETTAERAGFAGVTFGLTLPTGKTNVTNAEGEVAERSLQPGTGTTQLALSAYFREALPMHNSSWYAQVAALLPLNSHDNYKPGNQIGVDLGYRYDASDALGLNLQLNYVYKDRSKGSEAEPEDSGGHMVALTPGLTYAFTPAVQAYAFVQLPIYQYVKPPRRSVRSMPRR